jgi:hypothetical protein
VEAGDINRYDCSCQQLLADGLIDEHRMRILCFLQQAFSPDMPGGVTRYHVYGSMVPGKDTTAVMIGPDACLVKIC